MGRTEPWGAVVHGVCQQKGNARRIVQPKGWSRPILIKSKAAMVFCDGFRQQIKTPFEPFTEDVHLSLDIYYPSRRSDLDDSLVCDLLQQCAVIKNDRLIRSKRLKWGVDKRSPRVEIYLRLMTEEDYAS